MNTLQDRINAKIKIRAYKNEANPDGRVSLCGERVKRCEETGREYFEVPAHQQEYLAKLLVSYEFTDPFEVEGEAPTAPVKRGRKALPTG